MAERQVGATLEEIRPDHVARYTWATDYLTARAEPLRYVLDAACGCGYGTFVLARAFPEAGVTGLDIDRDAVDFARTYWRRANARFAASDVTTMDFAGVFDAIVSFETLEHTEHYVELLQSAYRSLKSGGVFIVSTPNELVRPFSPGKFPFHVRHFSPLQLVGFLKWAGFTIEGLYGQRKYRTAVTEGVQGAKHIIAVAVKP